MLVLASGGYAFCGFSSMSLLLMGFSNTWMLLVRRCGLFKVRLDGFLVGLMVILERFCNGLTQDLFLLLRRRLDFGFGDDFLVWVLSFYWFRRPSVEGVFCLFVEVCI